MGKVPCGTLESRFVQIVALPSQECRAGVVVLALSVLPNQDASDPVPPRRARDYVHLLPHASQRNLCHPPAKMPFISACTYHPASGRPETHPWPSAWFLDVAEPSLL